MVTHEHIGRGALMANGTPMHNNIGRFRALVRSDVSRHYEAVSCFAIFRHALSAACSRQSFLWLF